MNHYQILEVHHNASAQEIKQAYRRLVKQFHPDSNHQNASHETVIQLNEAYEILGDPHNRRLYDQKLNQLRDNRRDKNSHASSYYRQNRQQSRSEEISQSQWLQEVFVPINLLFETIILPLEEEIEDLSADIFDDDLMEIFVTYLANCQEKCRQAQTILSSQPNPSLYAGIAAYIYYGLNHINDGIEELERFTQTYEESYLYTGRELFNLAGETNQMATEMMQRFC